MSYLKASLTIENKLSSNRDNFLIYLADCLKSTFFMKKIIAANWKMHGDAKSLAQLTQQIISGVSPLADCIIFPPFVYLQLINQLLAKTSISLGAQNNYSKGNGSYTGEISCTMLKDAGCKYALVGHSERRNILKEDENFIMEKFHLLQDHDMIPILCVGESWEDKTSGKTQEKLAFQLQSVKNNFKDYIVAYEPVWAIGSGKTPTLDEIYAKHDFIKKYLAQNKAILYGGSLNEKNAAAILNLDNVDGGLIGGASLSAQKFVEISKCIK